jgi:hypothetical protein
VLVTLIAAYRILQIDYQPAAFPPSDGALSPAAAKVATPRRCASSACP